MATQSNVQPKFNHPSKISKSQRVIKRQIKSNPKDKTAHPLTVSESKQKNLINGYRLYINSLKGQNKSKNITIRIRKKTKQAQLSQYLLTMAMLLV